ncbi:MAG: hypothetical protein WKF88_10175 [Ferruginibacter sp.]
MNQPTVYSSILQDFAYPLLDAKDTDDIFMEKFKFTETVWNYCIAKEFRLPVFVQMQKTIKMQNKKHKNMKVMFDDFVERKETDFYQYKNFILNTELRIKADGSKTIYVESVKPEVLLKKLNV